jgi:hypothetical protein
MHKPGQIISRFTCPGPGLAGLPHPVMGTGVNKMKSVHCQNGHTPDGVADQADIPAKGGPIIQFGTPRLIRKSAVSRTATGPGRHARNILRFHQILRPIRAIRPSRPLGVARPGLLLNSGFASPPPSRLRRKRILAVPKPPSDFSSAVWRAICCAVMGRRFSEPAWPEEPG